jgi:hypothetical protein
LDGSSLASPRPGADSATSGEDEFHDAHESLLTGA